MSKKPIIREYADEGEFKIGWWTEQCPDVPHGLNR